MNSNYCLCCGSGRMLRHARSQGMYWFCMSCRQETVPQQTHTPSPRILPSLSPSLQEVVRTLQVVS
ncbi:MAG: hypothetical protein KME06_21610 [Kastovskya adunca ATA6-11-RM4]|jgi:hypothetical protein|nr:hypothetical protein [Kastovskya adunca ATA6-11-RM4]